MIDLITMVLTVFGTILAYQIAKWVYKRVYTPLLLPVSVATFIIIIFLLILNVPYETYMVGGQWINAFLGPAVVALSYPLYQNREVLKELSLPILAGTFAGAVIGIVTGVYLAMLIGFDETLVFSLTPKSVTTPVAMDISHSLGGIAPLAAVFVMIAGIFGAMVSKYVFQMLGLTLPVGRGVGLGSASHAIGTARALEIGQVEGSISTVAMILSAIIVSIITPLLVPLFL